MRILCVFGLLLVSCKETETPAPPATAITRPSRAVPSVAVEPIPPGPPGPPSPPAAPPRVQPAVVAFEAELGFACALLDTRRVFCWEHADDATYVDVPPVDAIHVGNSFACGLSHTDGALYCWGIDHMGQRGTGSADPRNDPKPRPAGRVVDAKGKPLAVADFFVGSAHACAMNRNGDVACWGSALAGETGAQPGHDGSGAWIAVKTAKIVFRGAVRLFGGQATSCAVDAKEQLYCWGDQDAGYNDAGSTLLPKRIKTPGPVRAMTFGSGHSCLLTDDAGVWCRGWNPGFQLGSAGTPQAPSGKGARNSDFRAEFTRVPELAKKYVSISASRNETCGVTADGELECLGTFYAGPVGGFTATVATRLDGFGDVVRVDNAMGRRCALDRTGVVRCADQDAAQIRPVALQR
jgi:hypothetical protein